MPGKDGLLPETFLTPITMETSCTIDLDDCLISGLLEAPSPNLLTNKHFLVMSTTWVTWPVSVSLVCCYSFLLGCGHTPVIQRHRCDADQSRKPRYLIVTLLGRHNRFELSTFGIKRRS